VVVVAIKELFYGSVSEVDRETFEQKYSDTGLQYKYLIGSYNNMEADAEMNETNVVIRGAKVLLLGTKEFRKELATQLADFATEKENKALVPVEVEGNSASLKEREPAAAGRKASGRTQWRKWNVRATVRAIIPKDWKDLVKGFGAFCLLIFIISMGIILAEHKQQHPEDHSFDKNSPNDKEKEDLPMPTQFLYEV
jgi:hypothetical protein